MTYYTQGFATFYDRYFTGWVRDYSPALADHLDRTGGGHGVLDLCCGTGVTTAVLSERGRHVTGLDRSAAMLRIAARRSAEEVRAGGVRLVEGDARDFSLPEPVGACVCLDGALNHFESREDLVRCFTSVAEALHAGGEFVFDLFELPHFRHWNNLTLIDEDDTVVAKRGAWDDEVGRGMLRVSGVVGSDTGIVRVEQTLRSRYYSAAEVTSALAEAGLVRVEHDVDARYSTCESGSCSKSAVPCRTVYRALKPVR
ncbi:dTDP-3-amino-3,4,6-trideoxy-alpha-D-glucopyranose [Streptomyces sp. ADI96-02]|uniref:class I SAM-dependent DNA methyltransferase n=1 Tax=unclassified Streptomyces TaxID=2593676 RepID=UPI000FBB11A0|nr:class I SAM-dependent methyltransferase [Streptomyces sp. ADI96-02]RPK54722.1 dTDP-3-amino-3,4,6-trideoxy-alpha-D-glucopyranose [Streptomyces sp. ADI96-02]